MSDDYEATFEDFWRELVCNPDGSLNVDRVKRELHDYRGLLENVPLVYDHITGGQVSKPHTLAADVIACSDDNVQSLVAEAVKEHADELTPGMQS